MRRMRQLCLAILFLAALEGFAQDSVRDQVHELQRGETIYTLARRYGVSADLLMDYNSIADATRLPVGAEIRIPGTYVVKEGEYIYSIARELGIDWQELLQSNGLGQNDVVRPGDVLLVPLGARTATTGTTSRETTALPGDESIADAADLAVEAVTTAPSATTAALLWPHPGERETWDGRFRGVVMSGESGDVFQSVTSGVVSFVGPFTSFGKLILVRAENGYLYGYAGADRVEVVPGQRVSNGTVLGSVGVSPAFQSARVLFTVWRNNRYIDPEHAPRG